jgi:uncharacterized spore protein YtfJ
MSDTTSHLLTLAEKREEQIASVLEKIYAAARSDAVYSEPVTSGNYTVITASEIAAGGGFGSGFGFGSPTPPPKQYGETSEPQASPTNGGAGGIGGGGGSSGRPVAMIIIGPDGVRVEPVVDVTKIALSALTVCGTLVMLLRRMRKAGRGAI